MQKLNLQSRKITSPLDETLNGLLKSQEVKRIKLLANVFDSFHLKNTVTTDVDGRMVTLNGKRVVNFASANYLGFDQNHDLIAEGQNSLQKWGSHSGSSRIFTNHQNILELEAELALLVGAEKTLIGVNTSMTHQMVIPTLFSQPKVDLLVDRHAHTSIYQACLTAKAKGANVISVDVSKISDVEVKLKSSDNLKVLFVDGIYSMQGHFPDLQKLNDLCANNNGILYIDDAHGIGVYGKHGGGVMEEFNLSYENIILIGGLQKGLACFGAFVAGSETLIDLLRVTSKAYIFSGPIQPAMVDQARKAIELCRAEEGQVLRTRLRHSSRVIRKRIQDLGFETPDGDSPIIPILIGDEVLTLLAGRKLFDLGIYLNSVLYPAVSKNHGILRISLTALHTDDQIDQLINGLSDLKEYLAQYQNPIKRALHISTELVKARIHGDAYQGL